MEFLPLVGIVLLFWLFIIRPQSRRQKELRSMQSSLSVGDDVMLSSGIFARSNTIAEPASRTNSPNASLPSAATKFRRCSAAGTGFRSGSASQPTLAAA